MNLYFAPMACSLATRIALYEAGAPASFSQVDLKSRQVLSSGQSFSEINRMGQVPALAIDAQTVLTENTAVLQFIARQFPEARLAPTSGVQLARMQQWLGFIGTELHKAIFVPLLDAKASEQIKEYARTKIPLRFAALEEHFAHHEFALDAFSIVDAYLTTILNWCGASGVDLKQWPATHAYHQRMLQRPSIARACGEEMTLYKEELKRHAR
ncbi:MAG: glutathione binding-like protein [Steroidobacter sp.]